MSFTSGLTGLLSSVAVLLVGARLEICSPARRLPLTAPGRSVLARARRRSDPRSVPIAIAALGLVGAVLLGPALTVVLAGIAGGFAMARRGRRARALRMSIEAAMPDATELLVISLHAGYSPAQAVGRLVCDAPAPIRPAFVEVERRLHRGAGVAEALTELINGCGPCALPLVNAMTAAIRDGLPLAPVLDRLADEAKASRRRQSEAAARRLPVRLSFPLVVCTLPSFVLLAIAPAVLGALSSLRGPTSP